MSTAKRCAILALDLETTIKSKTYMQANPMDPVNSIVMMGHQKIYPKLKDEAVGGLVISLPTYFGDGIGAATQCSNKHADFVPWSPLLPLSFNNQKNLYSIRNMCMNAEQEELDSGDPTTRSPGLEAERAGMESRIFKNVKTHGFTCDDLFGDVHTLVGQNIGFDILYLLRLYGGRFRRHLDHMSIWDVQTGEYLLTGQTRKFPNLDEVLQRVNMKKRNSDMIKEYWNAGIQTEAIPFYQLADYLRGDVENLYPVMRAQLKAAKDQDMLTFMRDQMESAWSLSQMSFEGMLIHKQTLADLKVEYQNLLTTIAAETRDFICSRIFDSTGEPVLAGNLDVEWWHKAMRSRVFWSKLLVDRVCRLPDKTLNIVDNLYPCGRVDDLLKTPLVAGKDGIYSIDGAILDELSECKGGDISRHGIMTLAKKLKKYRDYAKRLSTYVIPISDNMLPLATRHLEQYFPGNDLASADWAVLFPNYSDVGTATGRLTSSKPNMLNMANNEIKKVFKVPPGWLFVEWDFKQIEIIVLALLCKDKTLLHLLTTGADIHTFLYESLYGCQPTTAERKQFKRASFGLIYGSGAAGLVGTTGMSLSEVNSFIKNWKKLFPDSENYAHAIEVALKSSPVVDYTAAGEPIKHWQSPSKRLISFTASQGRSKYGSDFNWPQLKNYPIQSLATADIVKAQVAKLVRNVRNKMELSPLTVVCTIHDNAGMYVPIDSVKLGVKSFDPKFYEAARILSDVKTYLKGISIDDLGLPFLVDGTVYEDSWAKAVTELLPSSYVLKPGTPDEPAVIVDEEDL